MKVGMQVEMRPESAHHAETLFSLPRIPRISAKLHCTIQASWLSATVMTTVKDPQRRCMIVISSSVPKHHHDRLPIYEP